MLTFELEILTGEPQIQGLPHQVEPYRGVLQWLEANSLVRILAIKATGSIYDAHATDGVVTITFRAESMPIARTAAVNAIAENCPDAFYTIAEVG